jgi:acyl phosphate:glycerol-3-phosphate acyltransferase
MNWAIALLAAMVGYGFGAISFARVVANRVVPGEDISSTEFDIPGSDQKMVLRSVSATSLSMRKGPGAGCITSILDMVKASFPMLLFRFVFPEQPYYLIVGVTAVLGHNFPVQHKFKGGRGLSPIIGGLFVIDWLVVPVALIVSNIIGLAVLKDVVLAYIGFLVVVIPWVWFRFGDIPTLLYALAINILFLWASRPELTQYFALKRSGEIDKAGDFLANLEQTDMGRPIKYMRKYGLIKEKKAEGGEQK